MVELIPIRTDLNRAPQWIKLVVDVEKRVILQEYASRERVTGNHSRTASMQSGQKFKDTAVNAVNSEPKAESSITSDSDTDSEYAFTVHATQPKHNFPSSQTDMPTVNKPKDLPLSTVTIGNVRVKVLIDSGASVNILSRQNYELIKKSTPINLRPTRLTLHAFGSSTPVDLCGKFDTVDETKKRMTVATFYVTKDNTGSLLSCTTSTELGILHLQLNTIKKRLRRQPFKPVEPHKLAAHKLEETDTSKQTTSPKIKETADRKQTMAHSDMETELRRQYPDVFEGIGKLKNYEQSLHIDPQVAPVLPFICASS